ncbi:MAG: ATP-binding protein [Acidobacteriota bacterium]
MKAQPEVNVSADLLARLADSESRAAELEARLVEAEETLQAIRSGAVDALVVSGPDGDQIFALEGADHAYRMLVEEMQEGTVTLDESGLILYTNRQFASMMRASVETIVGSRINRFFSPGRHSLFSLSLADGENKSKRSELMMVAADGTLVPVSISLNRLETGGIHTDCVVINDLTEQRHYESMVKDGELSRLILDQVAEAIIVIDARGKILRASESAHKLAGRNILLQHFDAALQLWGLDRPVDTSRLFSTALAGSGLRSIEVTLRNPGRPIATLLLSTGPLWSGSRDLLGCVVTLTDISDRKKSEEVLARQAETLERTNSELMQFAYAVSHDLREPTRIIAMCCQLLENKYQGKLDEQADGLINRTVETAHRLETLLDDLLTYTQTAETPHAADVCLDANAVLAQTLNTLDSAITDSGAQIDSDPLPKLRVDEVHLQQLFQNLMTNSLKYRSEEPPRIRVSAQREQDMWKLSVADNGIGIDPQYHQQVFGLFKRLHGNKKYAGSGMGLAICQKIVERYGGRLWVESETGKGSQFFFTLPGEALTEGK